MSLEICRICGSNQNNLKHVFSEGNEELVDQIRLCANIQIDALDDLPKYVCNVCEQGLAFSYMLRKKGEETEKKLRQELLLTKADEAYPLEEVDEDVMEDACYEEMWIACDEDFKLDQDELGENIGDAVEILDVVPKEECDENEDWILQHEDFIETNEIIEDVGIAKVENNLMEIFCAKSLANEPNEPHESELQDLTDRTPRKMQINCVTCGDVFQSRQDYCEHIKRHGDKRYHCEICDKWFSVRYRYDTHKKNHNSEKGAFPCPKCTKTYTVQCNLERHIRSAHNGEKRFQCAECGANFGRADVLKMHMVKHTTERNIECDICQKKFKTSQHLHYHKKSHQQKADRPKKPVRLKSKPKPKVYEYICEYCDKVSLHRTTHLNHIRTHTGEKPFKCTTCDKAFRTTHARSNHMLLHTDERPHTCQVCSISFRQTSHLKSHMLIHTGVKGHVCQYCQKAFTMKSNLMVHLRMHTGDMPYKCDSCPQRFLQLSRFKRHKMSHMGEEVQQKETDSGNENELAGDYTDSQISVYVEEIESS